MLQLLILDCIHRIHNDRSLSGIYHILSGKRSAQTVQDAHIFQVSQYFGIASTLSRSDFDKQVKELIQNGYLISHKENIFLQEKAIKWLNKSDNRRQLDQYQGLKYDKICSTFHQRLLLFIQTLTNMESGNHHFVPICDDGKIHYWVKRLYMKEKQRLNKWLNGLYHELGMFLERLDQNDASLYVDRLSGYHQIGLSREQISKKYKLPIDDVALKEISITHQLLDYVLATKSEMNHLVVFLSDLTEEYFYLSESTKKTYHLLQKGLTVIQMANARNLKESTIYDHIIEIAHADPLFNINQFVSNESIKQILLAIDASHTSKLKNIRDKLDQKYSYFEIRLVLARYNPIEKKEYVK